VRRRNQHAFFLAALKTWLGRSMSLRPTAGTLVLAEGVGFEPTVRLLVRLISSQVPSSNSATLPLSE
jgi:hypothetical protein